MIISKSYKITESKENTDGLKVEWKEDGRLFTHRDPKTGKVWDDTNGRWVNLDV